MLPISFPEANVNYTKPEGWTDEQCGDLAVWQGRAPIDDKGNTAPTLISCWQPSKKTLKRLSPANLFTCSLQVLSSLPYPCQLLIHLFNKNKQRNYGIES